MGINGVQRETSGEYDVQEAQTPVDVQASAYPRGIARASRMRETCPNREKVEVFPWARFHGVA